MELQIAGTNIEITPDAQRYVERKLNKINKHLPDIIDAKVEISEEQTKSPQERYLVRVTVNGGVGGAVFHGEERGEDLFKAVDRVVAILSRQLERRKGKLYDKGRGNPLARGRFIQAEPKERQVVKKKRFIVEPMSLEEAIEQMEQLGHNFFLYFDADAEEARLLYRRNDGDYGLIEPEFR
ncbi:MAG: ribosome-associated translation inhibitor RaiA [Dehalococcoidales bacterium]|nr:ribosome-associated translation inhibitor RaiA [Dehalococcoidales bacterium]